MAIKKTAATKKVAKKAPKKTVTKKAAPSPAPSAVPSASAGLRKSRRATLRMTDADFNRLRWEILTTEKFSWQDLLSVSVNDWLEKNGYARLEEVE